jgi:hypothetical protein
VQLEHTKEGRGTGTALKPNHDGSVRGGHVLQINTVSFEIQNAPRNCLTVEGQNQKNMFEFVSGATVMKPEKL